MIKYSVQEPEPCPLCGGEIVLYSSYRYQEKSNCFARCKSCKSEFVVPTVLKAKGACLYPASVKKAYRVWNSLKNYVRRTDK